MGLALVHASHSSSLRLSFSFFACSSGVADHAFFASCYGYRCITRPLPLSDAHLLFPPLSIAVLPVLNLGCASHKPPLSIRLQVLCPISTSLGRAFPFSTALYPATGALHTLYFSPSRIFPFHRYLDGYRCAASSLPLCDAPLPFP